MAKRQKGPTGRVAAENRKARHHYFIEDRLEAGIVLEGS
ncbi:MAG: SsrA-binding protein, partial [Paracoccaceae bacterium]